MKIIEAMRQVTDLTRKASDIREKIARHCSDLDVHTPTYGTAEDQRETVRAWLQGHEDITREICRLKVAIQRTNIGTEITIDLGGKASSPVTKTIAGWIYRRRELARLDRDAWFRLGDRNLKEGAFPGPTPDAPAREVKIRRYYDQALRDLMVDQYSSEPTLIDGKLEIANAITDVLE